MKAKRILRTIAGEKGWVLSKDIINDIIIPAMKKYGKQKYNKGIEKSYEKEKS